MTVFGTWLYFMQQQQLSWGRAVSMHTAQPLPATEHIPACGAEPETVWSWKLSCVPERGERRRPGAEASREEGRQRRELASHTAGGSQRQTVHAALWLVCNSRDNVHWLYSLNCWRTDMTPNCCFYMFLLIGTKGKCLWLPFLFWALQSR